MTRRAMAMVLLIGVVLAATPLMAAPQEPAAAAAQKRCTVGMLQGGFAYYGDGNIVENSFGIPPGPFLSLGTAKFDGVGGFVFTSTDFPGLQMTGTYTVKANCTGSVVFNFPEPIPPSPGNLFVVSGGDELFIASPPGQSPFLAVFIYKRQ